MGWVGGGVSEIGHSPAVDGRPGIAHAIETEVWEILQ